MGTVEDIRKAVQDFIPPELRELSVNIKAIQNELPAMEVRLMREIKSSEEKILLVLQVSTLAERIAELTRENERLKEDKTQ